MTDKTVRSGSLQFWPRKKARKVLPSVNWSAIKTDSKGLLGFIGYKVGMASAYVKDQTPDSLTEGKNIVVPATVIEVLPLKILSVRFYKNNQVVSESLSENIDKNLKKKIKLPKNKKTLSLEGDYDDLRLVVYTQTRKGFFKKSPDLAEIGFSGNLDEKKEFVKNHINKEINLSEFINEGLIDIRGLTKGKGIQGPVRRFGISLRVHKSEKGVRKPGSIGPWHPARLTFRTPLAGQLGMFTRISYNKKIILTGNIQEKDINLKSGWKKYGLVKNNYIIVEGSVQGPSKRQLLLTLPLRPTKKQSKKNYGFIELR